MVSDAHFMDEGIKAWGWVSKHKFCKMWSVHPVSMTESIWTHTTAKHSKKPGDTVVSVLRSSEELETERHHPASVEERAGTQRGEQGSEAALGPKASTEPRVEPQVVKVSWSTRTERKALGAPWVGGLAGQPHNTLGPQGLPVESGSEPEGRHQEKRSLGLGRWVGPVHLMLRTWGSGTG